MIRNAIFAIYVFIIFVLSFLSLLPYFLLRYFTGKKFRENYIKTDIAVWARAIFKGSFSSLEIRGAENIPAGNVVIVSNHQSMFDILIILGYINKITGFIAKIELKRIPILNTWLSIIHSVYINRKNMRDSYDTIQEGVKSLNSGNSMVIFPEGKRSRSGVMGRFKSGSFKLAVMSGTPILPVTIRDSYKIYEEHKTVRPIHVILTIHPAIDIRGLSKEDINDLPGNVSKIVADSLQ